MCRKVESLAANEGNENIKTVTVNNMTSKVINVTIDADDDFDSCPAVYHACRVEVV